MTIRDGRREIHDCGPTPVTSKRIPGGSLAVSPFRGSREDDPEKRKAYNARRATTRAGRRGGMTCKDCGVAVTRSADGITYRHVERGLDHPPRVTK